MAEMQVCSLPQSCWGGRVVDFVVTMACWSYFILGFLFFFSFFYGAAYLFSSQREHAFQHLNHLFFKGFLGLLRILSPRQKWNIDQKIRKIESSIVVCNHLSYLDPLILISLFSHQKTIVKTRFFQAPVFGWLIKTSSYLPATTEGEHGMRMIEQVEKMGEFLSLGGNLFVFPEGTRNRDGKIGPLHKGVFKIARMQRCPIYVLSLCNTDSLFTPGKFLFNTRQRKSISMTILDRIEPEGEHCPVSVVDLEKKVRENFRLRSKSCDQEGRGSKQTERLP
jgi:1-acyl-sn-glycerol-3-phosphate acyltransferase